MSVKNFIQTIWSKKIQDDLELKLKLIKNFTFYFKKKEIAQK